MRKRVKLMIAALLGFSTACSTVKNSVQEQPAGEPLKSEAETSRNNDQESVKASEIAPIQRIKLMYGTPSPRPEIDSVRRAEAVEKQ